MKPSFALLLSQDGLVLCHRTSDGWLRVGEVLLTAKDVAGELAALRTRALEIAKDQKLGPLVTKLVLPNSEILYDTISVEGVTSPDYDAVIRERLDGRTPYAMDELCYDYVVTQGEAQVAVVARETLAEAEAFATEHGLDPVCFAAVPPKGAFAGEAMFGMTQLAPDLLAPSETLERDMAPVVILGETDWTSERAAPLPVAPTPASPEAETTADAPTEPVETPVAPEEPAVAGPEDASTEFHDLIRDTPAPDLPEPPAQAQPAQIAPRVRAEAAAKLTPPEAVEAAERLAEIAAPAKRSSRSLGLILTLALLAAMVLVGVVAAVLDRGEVVSTGEAPMAAPAETEVAQAAPDPVAETPRAQAVAEEASDATGVEASEPVIAEATPEPPADESTANSPVAVMTDGPPQPAAPANVVSRFEALPTPEEVAEGEEATVPGTPAPIAATEAPEIAELPETLSPEPPTDTETVEAPRELRPPLIETETRYAASGIWQRSPDPLLPITPTVVGDLYVAALDRDVAIEDALALPAYMDSQDLRPVSPQPPVAPGQFFELSEDGFVTPTPDGALTPEGVLVFSDPSTRPSPRPLITPVTTTEDLRLAELAEQRPPPRPKNVVELQERAELDGRSRAELAGLTPTPRPASIQELAAAETPDPGPENAMARSVYPDRRPSNFAQLVAEARATQTAQASAPRQSQGVAAASTASFAAAAPAPQRTTAPTIPTTASVARQATIENALRLNRINLIGVYGTPNSRRALVRLASGRYVKVEVGDRVDGGRVGAIGEDSLQYTKGGRNITLEMPRG
ncbi:hypothetical protein [Dinoroseobacter sp. S76]|uniref:hypothetical protein n=1 Tax=Dinoroseobacter sp. S76 TaxID=3415124 RepID=UPI003C7DAEFD